MLSILIPNFNNGRQSSMGGRRDFIADLFESLLTTLTDDPEDLEIIVADDGSTDDSLATCRTWAKRTWPSGPRRGQPFCRLIELPHCGVLSVVANRLTAESSGDICCRLDGDIVIHTPHWASRIREAFDNGPPDLGVVGPKQLGLGGRIHSAGSWILHPRGHHHVGQGAEPHLIVRAIEVDHVMGCFYCYRREIFDRIGGFDERFLRGQTVDFGLQSRLAGWRTWMVPSVVFTHYHADREARPTEADTDDGVETTLDHFTEKWGFDRLGADLDEVAKRYRGTPLLWNARYFGPSAPWPPLVDGPVDIKQSEWAHYAADEAFREAVMTRLRLIRHLQSNLDLGTRVTQVRCRSGLLCHLMSGDGLQCTGVDLDPHLLDLAKMVADREVYLGQPPEYRRQPGPSEIPVDDASADMVLLMDILEFHPNPVGLLKEAHRVLDRQGVVVIVTRQRRSLHDADHDALHGYLPQELVLQLQSSRRFTAMLDRGFTAPEGTLVLIGRRRGDDSRTYFDRKPVESIGAGPSLTA